MKLLSERMKAMATKKRIRTPAIWTILRDYAGEVDLLEKTIEICSHEILRLEKKERDLEAELTEHNAYYRKVINEECAPDEVHCTCVPALRDKIRQLEAKLNAVECAVCGKTLLHCECE